MGVYSILLSVLSFLFHVHSINSMINNSPEFDQRYFGYWGLGMNGLNGDISSTSNYSNLVFIREDTYDLLENKIKQAENLNLKIIVMIQNIVFPWHKFSLYSDWQLRWDLFQKTIIQNHLNSIMGFYLFDEPFHNFDLIYTDTNKDTARNQFNIQLNQLSDYIKLNNPNKILCLTYAYTEIESYVDKYSIPNSIDWIGVNCYLDFGSDCSETNIMKYYSILNNMKKSHQQFLLTLDAYTSQKTCSITQTKQNEIINRIDFILLWSQLNIPVIALAPFLYQEVHSMTEDLCGASSMVLVENRLKFIAENFISTNSTLSIPTKNICISDDMVFINLLTGSEINRIVSHPTCVPKCESDDLVRRNENGFETDRWISAPMCVPKCEGKNLVRRNEKNIIIDIWINAPMCQ